MKDSPDLSLFSNIISDLYDTPKCDINGGWCFWWALLVYRVIPDAKLCFCHSHAFIHIGDKFYDSDSPRGVRDPRKLKLLKWLGCIEPRYDVTLKEFSDFWNIHPITGDPIYRNRWRAEKN
jgi:hypothetical protein